MKEPTRESVFLEILSKQNEIASGVTIIHKFVLESEIRHLYELFGRLYFEHDKKCVLSILDTTTE